MREPAGISMTTSNIIALLLSRDSVFLARKGKTWGERRGSNPRHLGPQPSALPAELRPPCAVQGLTLALSPDLEESITARSLGP